MKNKKILSSTCFLISGFILGFGLYVTAEESSNPVATSLAEAEKDFTLFNSAETSVKSEPISDGKVSGDVLTAKEFNRVLELLGTGGSGSGGGSPTFVNFDGTACTTNGNECDIRKSNNVDRVVREEQGRFSIYFTEAFSDSDYVVFGTSSYGPSSRGTSVEVQTENSVYTDHVTIEVTYVDSDPSRADRPLVHVMVYDGSGFGGGSGSGTSTGDTMYEGYPDAIVCDGTNSYIAVGPVTGNFWYASVQAGGANRYIDPTTKAITAGLTTGDCKNGTTITELYANNQAFNFVGGGSGAGGGSGTLGDYDCTTHQPYVEYTATDDLFVTVKSGFNGGFKVNINGEIVSHMNAKRQYGQGHETSSVIVKAGDVWKIEKDDNPSYPDVEQVCTRTLSLGGGSGSGGAGMVPGWPDAVYCEGSSSNYIAFADYMPKTSDGLYYYRTPASGSAYIGVKFNADKTYNSNQGGSTDCDNKSISELVSEGKAFFFGGGGSGGSGPKNVSCASGSYVEGFDASGGLICKSLPITPEKITVEITGKDYSGGTESCSISVTSTSLCNYTKSFVFGTDMTDDRCKWLSQADVANACGSNVFSDLNWSWNGDIAEATYQIDSDITDFVTGSATVNVKDYGGSTEGCQFSFTSPSCTITNQWISDNDSWNNDSCRDHLQAYVQNHCKDTYGGTFEWTWDATIDNGTAKMHQ